MLEISDRLEARVSLFAPPGAEQLAGSAGADNDFSTRPHRTGGGNSSGATSVAAPKKTSPDDLGNSLDFGDLLSTLGAAAGRHPPANDDLADITAALGGDLTAPFILADNATALQNSTYSAAASSETQSREPAETLAAVPSPAKTDIRATPSRAASSAARSARTPTPAPTTASSAEAALEVPALLGGYQIERELGRGGMGSVYLARQLSLDRPVAVKVIRPPWSKDPAFVARFTREAYAAAQLTHHNVVQIYDIGVQNGLHYFSMEFVHGQPLNSIVKQQGTLDVQSAVGYVLQAARGLKFAHEQGMIHRDIKPDNLLLNQHGIVKVADLGLVKTAGAKEQALAARQPAGVAADAATTQLNIAMGTPAYMSPEQATNAAGVDERADIYSLGCTLYDLLTGRPPFSGNTLLEVITKHKTQPVVPPEAVVKRVPQAVSEIVLRMMAKRPEERYQSMAEVVVALEQFLGIESGAKFSPSEEHADQLEKAVQQFNNSRWAKLRFRASLALFAALLVATLALSSVSSLASAIALGTAICTPMAYLLIRGLGERSYGFLRLRDWLLSGRSADWGLLVGGAIIVFGGIAVAGGGIPLVCSAALACLIAVIGHALFDRRVTAERAPIVADQEKLLRHSRLKGIGEESLQQFVCQYAGPRWEEFFEALFGYEAKITARAKWGNDSRGQPRPKFSAWRDPLLRFFDRQQQARREARDRRNLQIIEEKRLKAQGLNEEDARVRAEQSAAQLVATAAQIKTAAISGGHEDAATKRARIRAMLEAAQPPAKKLTPTQRALRQVGRTLGAIVPKLQTAVGILLIGTCGLWMYQNGLLPGRYSDPALWTTSGGDATGIAAARGSLAGGIAEATGGANLTNATAAPVAVASDAATVPSWWTRLSNPKPLQMPILGETLPPLLGGINAGVAGIILLLSAGARSWISYGINLGVAAVTLGLALVPLPTFGPLPGVVLASGVLLFIGLGVFALGRE